MKAAQGGATSFNEVVQAVRRSRDESSTMIRSDGIGSGRGDGSGDGSGDGDGSSSGGGGNGSPCAVKPPAGKKPLAVKSDNEPPATTAPWWEAARPRSPTPKEKVAKPTTPTGKPRRDTAKITGAATATTQKRRASFAGDARGVTTTTTTRARESRSSITNPALSRALFDIDSVLRDVAAWDAMEPEISS